MFCDLHTHSVFSDGTDTPTRLVVLAKDAGLSAVALCDHNTVDGLGEFVRAAQQYGVTGVPGVEFSTDYEGTELHVLALFLRQEHYAAVTELMVLTRQRKEQSNRALAQALCRAGYPVDYERVREKAGGYVNRAHFAKALTESGVTGSVQEAFDTLLRPGGGFYEPPRRLTAFEVISFIGELGAVSVLAHPFLNLEEAALKTFLDRAVPLGLDAMETAYTTYDSVTARLASQIAAQYGLLPSGGSDYHGENKPGIRIGSGAGDLQVPEIFWKELERRAHQKGGGLP